MKIAEVETFPVSLKLKEPFVIGNVVNEHLPYVITRIQSAEGVTGMSEVAPAWEVTGETQNGVRAAVELFTNRTLLGDSLIGKRIDSLDDIREIYECMLEPVGGPQKVWRNSTAKCAIECAMLDMLAKREGVPVYKLFAVEKRDAVLMRAIGVMGVEETVKRALERVEAGHKKLKLKVGVRNAGGLPGFERDITAVKELGDELARRGVTLVADANQGYGDAETAISVLKRMGGALTYIEQPVAADDKLALKTVREATGVAVMADEAAHNLYDVKMLLDLEAVDHINIKLMKSSGILGAIRIARECDRRGAGYCIGSMIESTLGTAANLTAYCVLPNAMGIAGGGLLSMEKNIGSGLSVEGNVVRLPDAPGFGVEISDEELVEFR